MINDVIIVGGGAAAASAALGLSNYSLRTVLLDVGFKPDIEPPQLNSDLYTFRKKNKIFDLVVGEEFHGLTNLIYNEKLPPKLIAPYNYYISKDVQKISPTEEENFKLIQSFSKGGLAAGWGAGVYEYNNDELKETPIHAEELKPYYHALTKEIGVAGQLDDLDKYFGKSEDLLQPIKISLKSQKLLQSYQKKREKLHREGMYMGLPRLAILTEEKNGRMPCDYSNLEPWYPNLPYIYNPAFTIDRLHQQKKIEYRSDILVKKWGRDKNGFIDVFALNMKSGESIVFKTKKLILAAGTANTTKIVLTSKNDYLSRLPIYDNPLIQIPIIFPGFIGKSFIKREFGMTNLNVIFDFKDQDLLLQGSLIELNSPARGTFFEMFPFSASGNMKMIRNLAPAAMVLFLYYPSQDNVNSVVSLDGNGQLLISSGNYTFNKGILKRVGRNLQKLGVLTSSLIFQKPPPGYAIHYAGTIPMVENPEQPYQCNISGELNQEKNVFIADGSLFSKIAAKNITFTIMANAMRIGENVAQSISNE